VGQKGNKSRRFKKAPLRPPTAAKQLREWLESGGTEPINLERGRGRIGKSLPRGTCGINCRTVQAISRARLIDAPKETEKKKKCLISGTKEGSRKGTTFEPPNKKTIIGKGLHAGEKSKRPG